MAAQQNISSLLKRFIITMVTGALLLFGVSNEIKAQEPPPRPPEITLTTDLSFGAFYQGAVGGTISISPAGSRAATGDIVLLGLGYPFSAAHYNIYSNPGTVISILNGPDVPLSWGGYSMNLHIGSCEPVSPFVNTNPYAVPTELTVGATLTVGNPLANPPGNYTGTFDITLVLE
jgi:hypothetical protein